MKIRNKAFRAAAFLIVLCGAVLVIASLVGFTVFSTNIDNSKKSAVEGCYYSGRDIVVRVYQDRMDYGQMTSSYSVVSDKMGLALLPDDLLRIERSGSSWRIVKRAGLPELIPYIDGNSDNLSFLTPTGETVTISKGACPTRTAASMGSTNAGA
jgi:hypothetical protein